MIHRTFRRLDEPTKLFGFSLAQWAALIIGGGGLAALLHVLAVPTKPALTLMAFLVGVPTALAYTSEHGRVRVGRLLLDAVSALRAPERLEPGAEPDGGFLVELPADQPTDTDQPAGTTLDAPPEAPWA